MAIALLAASLALGAAATAGSGAEKKPRPKPKLPDLLPTAGHLTGDKPYAFLGKRVQNSWKGTIKNDGKGRAGSTLTRVYLAHRKLTTNFPARFALAAASTSRIDAGESERTEADPEPLDSTLPPGGYYLYVCADAKDYVKESNEDNNCRFVGDPKRFYLAFERWTGTLRGSAPMSRGGDTREDWHSEDVVFADPVYLDPGGFKYEFSGTVSFTERGTESGGCTVSGSGNATATLGTLFVKYEAEVYSAVATASSHSFEYTLTCETQQDTYPAPENSAFLNTFGSFSGELPLPFGTRNIFGGYTGLDGVNNTWDLTGATG